MITTLKFSTSFSLCFPVTCCITVPTGPLALIFFFSAMCFDAVGRRQVALLLKNIIITKNAQFWFSSASEQSLWEPIPLKLPETSESPSLILLICVIFSLNTQPSWKSQWMPRHQHVHEAWGPPWLFGEADLTQHSCKRSTCWRLARSVAVSEKLCALQHDHHLCFISSRPTCFTTVRNYCLGVLNYSRRGSCAQRSVRCHRCNSISGNDAPPPFLRHKSPWATRLVAGEALGGACCQAAGERAHRGCCGGSSGCLATGSSATAFFLMKVFHDSRCDYLCWIPRRITSELPTYSSWLSIILHQNHFARLLNVPFTFHFLLELRADLVELPNTTFPAVAL